MNVTHVISNSEGQEDESIEIINSQENDTQSMFLNSDEEFPDTNEYVNNYEIKNYKEPKYWVAQNVIAPVEYQKGNFKPTVVSLNNKIIFISAGSTKLPHDPKKSSNIHCGLSPHCNIEWSHTSFISRVFVFNSLLHPKNNKETWVCSHHNDASMSGVKLQTQNIQRRFRAGTGLIVRDENPEINKDLDNEEKEEKSGKKVEKKSNVDGIKALEEREEALEEPKEQRTNRSKLSRKKWGFSSA